MPNRSLPGMIYLGSSLFLLLMISAILYFRMDWNASIEGSRAQATYEMVHNVIPNRPTDTPGAIAWLHQELGTYLENQAEPLVPAQIAQWHDNRTIPSELEPLGKLLIQPIIAAPLSPLKLTTLSLDDPLLSALPYFRNTFYTGLEDDIFVITRRKSLGLELQNIEEPANAYMHRALPYLTDICDRLPAIPQSSPYRVVRLYSLCEDGSLMILPTPPADSNSAARLEYLLNEGAALRKMPKLPNFVSNEFFFVFGFQEEPRPFFSGLYLDLGGQGLVASLTAPLQTPDGELKGIIGMDITFNKLKWQDFAQKVKKPLVVEVVSMDQKEHEDSWQPWGSLLEAGPPQHPGLQKVMESLARTEGKERRFHNPSPIYHAVTRDQDALVAFRVSSTEWLVILFPRVQPLFPTGTLIFLSVLFLALLVGFEWNRRSAIDAGRKAVREFEEKQNLLETMQVPLMVVDPNTENVVYGNRAALELGIQQGRSVKDLVVDDPLVRQHYDQMQVAGREERRAYGLPLKVGQETRYAVIRSVAVRAPIEMIHADEHHRLGILFLLDPEKDLGLYTRSLIQQVVDEERFRLAGLLDHGVDSLARILERRLRQGKFDDFTTWLSGYVQRRIRLSAWVLNHWDVQPPLPPDCIIEASNVRATLDRLNQIFCIVRGNANLRSQLHWNNGVLSGWQDSGEVQGVPLVQRISWPDHYCFSCPVQGGLGLFLSEVLVNAIRHGKSKTQLVITIRLDAVRRELRFRVENQTSGPADRSLRPEKKYGGRAILEQLARLFEWQDLTFIERDQSFSVAWRVPCGERAQHAESD